jgi:hypothetical protein
MKNKIKLATIVSLGVVGLSVFLKPFVFPSNYYSSTTDTCHVGQLKITHFTYFENQKWCTANGGYKLGSMASEYPEAVIDANTFDMAMRVSLEKVRAKKVALENQKYEAEQQKAADEEAKKTLLWSDGQLAGMQSRQNQCFEEENKYGVAGIGC